MYSIKITEIEPDHISVDFPENKINNKKQEKKIYKILNECIIVSNGLSKQIKCPNYTRRVVICVDILMTMSERNVSKIELNGKRIRKIQSALRKSLSIEDVDKSKENKLARRLMTSLINNETQPDIEEEIKNGYNLIIDLYLCGGIK